MSTKSSGVDWKRWVITFIILVSFLSVTIYLKNNQHPAMAGMVAVMPVALATIIYCKKSETETFAFSMGLGLASYSIASFALYYLIRYQKYDRLRAIIYSMILWLITMCLFYYIFTDGPYSANGTH